jgi:hypothetical protein
MKILDELYSKQKQDVSDPGLGRPTAWLAACADQADCAAGALLCSIFLTFTSSPKSSYT